jgi:hypothetical protein
MPSSDREYTRNGRGTPGYTTRPEWSARGDPSAGAVHTVFSVDGSLYQRWQADLLAYSHRKVGQSGPLTRLFSAYGPPTPFEGRTFHTRPYSPHPATGDHYLGYNRVMALRAWLEESPPEEEVILLLDPDCVFLAPLRLTEPVSRGHPVSQPVFYMDPVPQAELLKKHGLRPELVDAVGIPTLIHRDDLMVLAPLWVQKTEMIRQDPRSRELASAEVDRAGGWLAETWCYTLAAAALGLRHTTRELARVNTEDLADLPIVHYYCPASDTRGNWEWNKWSYRPWERVPDPPDDVPLACKALIGLLNEWVAMPEHQVCLNGPLWLRT